MPRNLTGGKGFKKGKKGAESRGAMAAREAADEMVELLMKKQSGAKLTDDEEEACNYLLVGRVVKRLGNQRLQVACHDNTIRQCRIRGKLRKVPIFANSLVLVSLRNAEDSDEDEEFGGKGGEVDGTSDVVGVFSLKHEGVLRSSKMSRAVFINGEGAEEEDIFDYGEAVDQTDDEHKTKEKGKSQKGKERSSVVDIDAI